MWFLLLIASLTGARAEGPDADEEIEVVGESLDEVRREAAETLANLGYKQGKRRGPWTIYRSTVKWKPSVRIHDDGFVMLRRAPVRAAIPSPESGFFSDARVVEPGLGPPPEKPYQQVCLMAACADLAGASVSGRKLAPQKAKVVNALEPTMQRWREVVGSGPLEERLRRLPEQLERLWTTGEPLDGGVRLATVEARREAILAFWSSRADTREGDRVRAVVEAFLEEVVQTSDTPVPVERVAAVNEARHCQRELVLRTR